jgi:hypothetical protein
MTAATTTTKTTKAEQTTIVSNALGSAAAGIVGRLLTHPLDTGKARLQSHVGGHSYNGALDVLYRTSRQEGIRGLYRGFSAVIVGGTPGTIIYLCSYDIFKGKLSSLTSSSSRSDGTSNNNEATFMVHFASGILAETLACLIYVPVDVIKERLQVQHKTDPFQYKGGWDALVQISKKEGIGGIYKGYGATLASFGPFSALYFMLYEKFKFWSTEEYHRQQSSLIQQHHLSALPSINDTLPFPWIVLSSASAGAISSFLTSPLDMAKLRLQVQRGTQHQSSSASSSAAVTTTTTTYRGIGDALQSAYQKGGMKGLFRGAGARVLHFVPATTVTMTCYETCRTFFQDVLQR